MASCGRACAQRAVATPAWAEAKCGFEGQRLPVGGHRLVQPALLQQQLAQRVLRVGIAREGLGVGGEGADGLVGAPLEAQRVAQHVPGGCVAPVERHGPPQQLRRAGVLALAEAEQGQRHQGPRVLGVELRQRLVVAGGAGHVPAGGPLRAQHQVALPLREARLAHQRHRTGQGLEPDLAIGGHGGAEQVGQREAGVLPQRGLGAGPGLGGALPFGQRPGLQVERPRLRRARGDGHERGCRRRAGQAQEAGQEQRAEDPAGKTMGHRRPREAPQDLAEATLRQTPTHP
ncbi:MAG: hypothetical protein QM767_27915 [Anaeromyxobacter sp.]